MTSQNLTYETPAVIYAAEQQAELAELNEDDLRAVIAEARALLAAKEKARRDHAVAEIRRLAREAGLDVAVKRKRRRIRKTKPAA